MTLAQMIADGIDKRLSGGLPDTDLARFVSYPNGAAEDCFVPNPHFWAKDVDFSCASPWNSSGGACRAGTLISRRHVVFAHHFPIGKGARIVFVGTDGGVCPCYVEKSRRVADSDIMVGLLNAEVTPNVHPARIMSPSLVEEIRGLKDLPMVTFNQKEEASVTEMGFIPADRDPKILWSHMTTNETRSAHRRLLVAGDSGNPAFLIVGNEPILLYCLLGGGSGTGSSLFFYRREIQVAMDELCPGYKLEAFDFSRIKNEM